MESADDGDEMATFLLTNAGGANAEAPAKNNAVAATVNFIFCRMCVVCRVGKIESVITTRFKNVLSLCGKGNEFMR